MVTNFPGFNLATSVKCYENVMAAFCSQHKHLLISEFGVYHIMFDLRFDCVYAHSHPCMN